MVFLRTIPVQDRLMRRVEMVTESGCWIYTGPLTRTGYVMVSVRSGVGVGKIVSAHRLMYQIHRGPIPDGLTIDHLCRIRCCLNPWHMEPVTQRENALRGNCVSALNARKTACPKCGGPYVVLAYRHSGRICKPCWSAQQAIGQRRRRAARKSAAA